MAESWTRNDLLMAAGVFVAALGVVAALIHQSAPSSGSNFGSIINGPFTITTPPGTSAAPTPTPIGSPMPTQTPPAPTPAPALVKDVDECGTDYNGSSAHLWNIGGDIGNPNAAAVKVTLALEIVFPDGYVGVSHPLTVILAPNAGIPFAYGTAHHPDEPLPNDPHFSQAGGGCAAVVQSTNWA